jgi:uncharacterized membrane protein
MKFLFWGFAALIAINANAIEAYRCVGTEPFWMLDMDDEGATFSPMDGTQETFNVTYRAPEGTTTSYVLVADAWTGKSKLTAFVSNGGGFIVADQKGRSPGSDVRAYCSDGMSDWLYPFSVNMIVDDRALTGCCSSSTHPAIEPKAR